MYAYTHIKPSFSPTPPFPPCHKIWEISMLISNLDLPLGSSHHFLSPGVAAHASVSGACSRDPLNALPRSLAPSFGAAQSRCGLASARAVGESTWMWLPPPHAPLLGLLQYCERNGIAERDGAAGDGLIVRPTRWLQWRMAAVACSRLLASLLTHSPPSLLPRLSCSLSGPASASMLLRPHRYSFS